MRRLPVGERPPLLDGSLVSWTTFPFEGDFQAKPLQPPVLPEPALNGEADLADCRTCRTPITEALWADEHWRLDALGTQLRLPAAVLLQPRGHYDLTDLPAERAAELGPLLQRVERAMLALDGVARVHINRWATEAPTSTSGSWPAPLECSSSAAPFCPCGKKNSCRPSPKQSASTHTATSPPLWPPKAAPPTRHDLNGHLIHSY